MAKLELENLHMKLVKSAGDYHIAQANLLDHLQEAERLRLHLHRGFSSLFDYVTKEIGLSESCASNFINVARKSLEFKALKEGIRQGLFGVSKARKVTSILEPSNQKELLDDLEHKNTREIERKVASKTDAKPQRETLKPIAKNLARLTVDIDDELVELLDQLKDLVAPKITGKCTVQAAIKVSVKDYIERHDPQKRAERAKQRQEKHKETVGALHTRPVTGEPPVSTPVIATFSPGLDELSLAESSPGKESTRSGGTSHVNRKSKKRRGSIPAWVLHRVHERDRGQCVYQGKNGNRCTGKRYIHLHHQIPVAQGGKHHPDNLVTLCSAHHGYVHETFN